MRDYFTFNKRERNGLIVLLAIMTAIASWPAIFKRLHKEEPVDFTAFQRSIDSFRKRVEESSVSGQTQDGEVAALDVLDQEAKDGLSGKSDYALTPYPFNPNLLDAKGWRRLGIQEKTIRTILNYKAKGGRFYKKEDLKKIYGFSEADYDRLESYIQFPSAVTFKEKDSASTGKTVPVKSKPVTELNSADSLQLLALQGVGPVLSSRIIRYRDKLGGFHSIEQLKEIYGLSPESYELISGQCTIDATAVHKLDINTITVDELKLHPYFRYTLAKMVINYRDQHGVFTSAEQLRNVDLITDSILEKIEPYLQY